LSGKQDANELSQVPLINDSIADFNYLRIIEESLTLALLEGLHRQHVKSVCQLDEALPCSLTCRGVD
jgi:hypothetical protein